MKLKDIKQAAPCCEKEFIAGATWLMQQLVTKPIDKLISELAELHYHADNDTITAIIDGREWLDADCATIASNDGLSVQDFKEWFFGEHPKEDKVFKGGIIHFTDFRY